MTNLYQIMTIDRPRSLPATIRKTAFTSILFLSATALPLTTYPNDTFSFRVLGDAPYGTSNNTLEDLETEVKEIDDETLFLVHVGDFKAHSTPCKNDAYTDVRDALLQSPVITFVIPGDNEWNDCQDPDDAWDKWVEHFSSFDSNFDSSFEKIYRQTKRSSKFSDNFAFIHNDILFVGINLVGGKSIDLEENTSPWNQRLRDNAEWVESWLNESVSTMGGSSQAAVIFAHSFADPVFDRNAVSTNNREFTEKFIPAAQSYGKPILYIMGDEHQKKDDRPYPTAQNIQRIIVPGGPATVDVAVSPGSSEPFGIVFPRVSLYSRTIKSLKDLFYRLKSMIN